LYTTTTALLNTGKAEMATKMLYFSGITTIITTMMMMVKIIMIVTLTSGLHAQMRVKSFRAAALVISANG
jgi:hypothetical protein